MKKRMVLRLGVLLLAGMMLFLCAVAAAEQRVQLPDSRYSLLLPDDMEYDGPGEGDTAKFAYVSRDLDIHFFTHDARGIDDMKDLAATLKERGEEDVQVRRINGLEMIVYRKDDPSDDPSGAGMRCIGYVLKDGNMLVEISMWYATERAAKLTAEIIQSLE